MPTLNTVSATLSLQKTLSDHPTVFSEVLGCYNGPPVKLSLNKDAQPTFAGPAEMVGQVGHLPYHFLVVHTGNDVCYDFYPR